MDPDYRDEKTNTHKHTHTRASHVAVGTRGMEGAAERWGGAGYRWRQRDGGGNEQMPKEGQGEAGGERPRPRGAYELPSGPGHNKPARGP